MTTRAHLTFTAAASGGGTLSVTDNGKSFSAHFDCTYTSGSFNPTRTASGETIHVMTQSAAYAIPVEGTSPATADPPTYRRYASTQSLAISRCACDWLTNLWQTRLGLGGVLRARRGGSAPIASEALARIAELYRVETTIRGQDAVTRRAARQEKTKQLLDALEPWLREKLLMISQKTRLAEAIRYALPRWDGPCRFIDDGRVEIDSCSTTSSQARQA